jgi:hypothetical protein
MKNKKCPSGKKAIAGSTLKNIEEVLGRYVWILKKENLPCEINVENLRTYKQVIKDRPPSDEEAAYKNQRKQAETFNTATR